MKEWETRRDGEGVRERQKDIGETEMERLVKCGVPLPSSGEGMRKNFLSNIKPFGWQGLKDPLSMAKLLIRNTE